MDIEDEDFPGQRREAELYGAVNRAVMAADAIILEASDGSEEETDLLTAQVAEKFFEKVMIGLRSKKLRKEMEARMHQ